jgi:DsbC/DsbD-like thiol-disulfide interchange protein
VHFRTCCFPLRYSIVLNAFFRITPPVLILTSACGGAPTPPPVEPSRSVGSSPEAHEVTTDDSEAPSSRESVPESVVQVTFEPLVTAVRAGRPFLLAAHFRIASGYRISGKKAGEVGKETVVSFTAPDGFEVGQVAFPTPERYTVAGYVGLGYREETVVFVEVKPPKKLKSGAVHRFDLSASWVACKRECATEHTDAFLELATGYGDVAAKQTEAELAPFKARLPTPLADGS